MALVTSQHRQQIIHLRSGPRRCILLQADVWVVGTTLVVDGPLYFLIDYKRWLVQLRLSALRYRSTFINLFGVNERELAEWFRHERWPGLPWIEVARSRTISAASKAGFISDPRELGFTADSGAVVERPLAKPTLRII